MDSHKRPPSGPHSGPAPKRGPASGRDEIDDLIEDEANWDEEDAAVLQPPEEEMEVDLGEAGRNWMRPPVAPIDPKTQSVGAWAWVLPPQ